MKFKVEFYTNYYIAGICSYELYLWKDGTTHDYMEKDEYFITKKEAEEFLTNYERKAMSEKLKQVNKDIALVEESLRTMQVDRDKIKQEQSSLKLKSLADEAKKQETFRAGQVFKTNGGKFYMLAQVGYHLFCIISMSSGNRRRDAVNIPDDRITRDTLARLASNWLNLKPVKVNIQEVN